MGAVPEDIQILFDQESSDNGSVDSEASSDVTVIDRHREQYPAYQGPHQRGHNVGQDNFVNFRNRRPEQGPDPDRVEGVDNDKYQRLILRVPYALHREKLDKLKKQFPGVFFHCKDNGNHDHQFSHAVTMIGTRMLQRRIKPGSNVLDVYGNPNACDTFNRSQVHADNPKAMKALVSRMGPADFIREVNKWGPFMDDAGDERYHRGLLTDMVTDGSIADYNVLQLIHTLYYIDFGDLARALHAPVNGGGKRVAYALVHRHPEKKGELNDGEQRYEKATRMGRDLLRQVNVATNSAYYHPDISPMLFSSDKTWMPDDGVMGLAWECHLINDETWVIEIVPYELVEQRDGVVDYAEMWHMDEDDYETASGIMTPDSSTITVNQHDVVIPTADGKFIMLEITNQKLFQTLRTSCVGKARDGKLLDELIRVAKHHVNPSALFGDKQGLHCPPDKIFDHAVAAYFADMQHEEKVMASVAVLRPVLQQHASNLKLGPKFKDYSLRDLLSAVKSALGVARTVNQVIRAKDPVDTGLAELQTFVS